MINGVHGPEPRSSGENTSSNPQVSALIIIKNTAYKVSSIVFSSQYVNMSSSDKCNYSEM